MTSSATWPTSRSAACANRSVRERWRKWCRRQPYALFRVKILVAAACAVVTIAAVFWSAFLGPRFRAAENALREGRALLYRGDYPQAARTLTSRRGVHRRAAGRQAAVRESSPRHSTWPTGSRTPTFSTDSSIACGLPNRRQILLFHWHGTSNAIAGPSGNRGARCWNAPAHRSTPPSSSGCATTSLTWPWSARTCACRLATGPKAAGEAHKAGLALIEQAESLFGPSHVLYRARQRARRGSLRFEYGRRCRSRRVASTAPNGLGA